jgi:flagellar hook assembly protein FlgD
VSADNGSEIPLGFELSQNYPNPFNPTTSIAFRIQGNEFADAQLTVYNLLGQAIRVLVNQPMAAGSYTVLWDGRDGSGNLAASGAYIYRLQIGNDIQSRQMLLLK